MEQRLMLEQSQKLILTPELKQAMTILTLPVLALSNYIQHQMEENPVLELSEGTAEEAILSRKDDPEGEIKELFDDRSDWGLGFNNSREVRELAFEPAAVQYSTLADHLMFQLHVSSLSEGQIKMGEYIVDNISPEGYLTCDVGEIADVLKKNHQEIYDIINTVKTFDPAGVGASNLAECLKLQLDADDACYRQLVRLIDEHLDDLAANRMQLIAKSLQLRVKETQELADRIKQLDPKPGLRYAGERPAEYIMPDVVIERVGDQYVAIVNDTLVPRLQVNSYYKNIIRHEREIGEQGKKFIEGKLNAAVWLIKSIEQRRMTLYKVTSAVIEYQKEFLDKGIEFLYPLILKDVAEMIGVHESTVSRAINEKYVQTPRGTFPWKFFFASGVQTAEGEAASANWIKKMIREYISQEKTNQPLSDQKLTDLLEDKGIQISRRTVAKYREAMGIPGSSKRKRF